VIVLFDTNAYTAFARGEAALLARLDRVERLLMSAVVVGELEYGFRNGNRYSANRASLDGFLAEPYVEFLPVTRDTTGRYGQVCAELQRRGRKIPANDAWIASHALEHGAELWTKDAHFAGVGGLAISDWTS